MSDLAILTEQEVCLLGYIRQGLPALQAIRMSGYIDIQDGLQFLEQDARGSQAMYFASQLHQVAPKITKDLLTAQFYEERSRSTTSMEGVACLREVGKLHGLYETKLLIKEAEEGEGAVQKTMNQISRMSDEAILRDLQDEGLIIDLLPEKIDRTPTAESIEVKDG
jgi:hypothetical protein